MRLVTALLVKNEKDKYLERVLRRCLEFSDSVLVLDDGSTDGSDRVAWRLGCQVKQRVETGMWGNESPARAELWDWGSREAGDGWLLICDADMLLQGDPRPLTYTSFYNSWAWTLYDVWDSESTYRKDGFWQGHEHPRTWMFRPVHLECETPIWNQRGLHAGHAPLNVKYVTGIADHDTYRWIHLAYLRKEHRLEKHSRYLSQSHQLSSFEKAHAESVAD